VSDNPYLDRFDAIDKALSDLPSKLAASVAAVLPGPGYGGPGTPFPPGGGEPAGPPVIVPDPPPPVPPTPTPITDATWWKRTVEQTAAFAKRIGWSVADLLGARQAIGGNATYGMGGTVDPAIAPFDGTEADAKLYAAFGFNPITGTRPIGFPGEMRVRGSWATEHDAAMLDCDSIYEATSPEQANKIIYGAGDPGVTGDLATFLFLIGRIGIGSPAPSQFSPYLQNPGWFTIVGALEGLAAPPALPTPFDPNAPGPGIGR
jgi:hypothetical protein